MRFSGTRADVNNTAFRRNTYAGAGGMTTGTLGTADSPYTLGIFGTSPGGNTPDLQDPNSATSGQPAGTAAPASGGLLARPFTWWFALAGMLALLMWGAQRFGSEAADFKNIKLSLFNILVISLASIIGITFFKILFSVVRVPGASDLIAAV